ncbi:MAG: TetR/AcrR family transcriptional regulator [Actinomycetota bacterium]
MVSNPERRTALLDAAIEVLADAGARGLTFRMVDTTAGVPIGTASNYFSSRDDLLTQVGEHLYVRFAPDASDVAAATAAEPSRELVADLMRRLVHRIADRRTVYIALLELRLEATRRPALRDALTRRVGADLKANIRFHLDAGLPGDHATVLVLYLAMNGLLVEHLTLPGVLDEQAPVQELADLVVSRIAPGTSG